MLVLGRKKGQSLILYVKDSTREEPIKIKVKVCNISHSNLVKIGVDASTTRVRVIREELECGQKTRTSAR